VIETLGVLSSRTGTLGYVYKILTSMLTLFADIYPPITDIVIFLEYDKCIEATWWWVAGR